MLTVKQIKSQIEDLEKEVKEIKTYALLYDISKRGEDLRIIKHKEVQITTLKWVLTGK